MLGKEKTASKPLLRSLIGFYTAFRSSELFSKTHPALQAPLTIKCARITLTPMKKHAAAFVLLALAPAAHASDEPSYTDCFNMMETVLKAQTVMLQAEADALSNPRNVPVTVPNPGHDAAADKLLGGVTLQVDTATATVSPVVEVPNYDLTGEDGDTPTSSDDDTPPKITHKELCKVLYGIVIP
jgi:hypothetical protein